jgi:RsiW-degrading membrane proteinase PrsW (M82 family)
MGSYIGHAKFNPIKETRLLTTGVVLAIFCHGLYDFLALSRSAFSSLIILLLGILLLWTRRQLKKAEAESRLRADRTAEKEEKSAEQVG